jgi:aspartate aminotransferase-like enzyme
MSNALTRVILPKPVAGETVRALAEEGLFVNPCGGALGERCFRVAHIGDLSEKDNAQLVIALGEVLESLGA